MFEKKDVTASLKILNIQILVIIEKNSKTTPKTHFKLVHFFFQFKLSLESILEKAGNHIIEEYLNWFS